MKRLLAMWCNTGLECVIDVTAEEQKVMWAQLHDQTYQPGFSLQMMKLRAQTNSQRHYEIYVFDTEDVHADSVREQFDACPQAMVDWIREYGDEIYSDRVRDSVIV
jgi:hypothetical protein